MSSLLGDKKKNLFKASSYIKSHASGSDIVCLPEMFSTGTDLWLTNEAERHLYIKPHVGSCKKPRTYRNKARRDYLNIGNQKSVTTTNVSEAGT